MGVIFGGGSSTVFGSSGAGSLLTKLTGFLAAIFLITSLLYNVLISSTPGDETIMTDIPAVTQPAPVEQKAPVTDDIPTAKESEPAK
ncbi:preprotein translocase subunit SecG [Desulfobaculum bizertense DSM 18034]|uniref:Protein-export membrane protein SecG n=2 Tax=Desulfobaculum TaxID=1433996 RepID=A0A1T4W2K2_9BACT|nr:preprotein translocase subunit SecG [Desulfobaculum bizertense DSM 18034]